jgi:hypothetical protein
LTLARAKIWERALPGRLAASPFHVEGVSEDPASAVPSRGGGERQKGLRLLRAPGPTPARSPERRSRARRHDHYRAAGHDVGDGRHALLHGAGSWCWFFGAIDHHTDEVLSWHTANLDDRWAAREPIRQGVAYAFGGFAKDLARCCASRATGP